MEDKLNSLTLYVNGAKIVDPSPDPAVTLLRYLRTNLFLTGTKEGCSEGGCGACTVMISKYEPQTDTVKHYSVNACLTLAVSIHGMAVTTVEGIGSLKRGLHPVQERLAKAHGSQCGFCTPGFAMAMYTLLRNSPHPSMQEIEENLSGNLCRCTGYRPILEGFRTFCQPEKIQKCPIENCCKNRTKTDQDEFLQTPVLFDVTKFKTYDPTQDVIFPPELKITPLDDKILQIYKGPEVTYLRPKTLQKLLELKKQNPKACLVAGNTEIGIHVKYLDKHYPILIDVTSIEELKRIEVDEKGLEIGAGATLTDIQTRLRELMLQLTVKRTRVLSEVLAALESFASKQIRNVATLGGNIMNGSPISDLIPLLMATNSLVKLRNHDAERTLNVDGFFSGYKKNLADASEVLISVYMPFTRENEYVKFYKQSRRKEDDLAIVNAAFRVEFNKESDVVSGLWMAYGGMAETTVIPKNTMKALKGRKWNSCLLDLGVSHLLEELTLDSEAPGGMIQYRRALVVSLFFKFFQHVRSCLSLASPWMVNPLPEEEISSTVDPKDEPLRSRSMQFFQKVPKDQEPIDPVGRPVAMVSCLQQTTGEAEYVDDIPSLSNELHAAYVTSRAAKARIIGIDPTESLGVEGVKTFFCAKDLEVAKEGQIFGVEEVQSVGQIIGLVVADRPEVAHKAASKVIVKYQDLQDPTLTLKNSVDNPHLFSTTKLKRGDIEKGFKNATHILVGEFNVGGQEHFYLEPQVSLVIPRDGEELEIFSACHGLKGLQEEVSKIFSIPQNKIICRVKRLGGSFGGKERPNKLVLPLVLAAKKTGCPVRAVLTRRDDMLMTGGRHPMLAKWTVGFMEDGTLTGLKMGIYLNAGWNSDFSKTVLMTAIDKIDGPYRIDNCDVVGYCCKTNLPSNTAFRGFGGPQVTVIMDDILSKIADYLSLDEHMVKQVNLNGKNSRDVLLDDRLDSKYYPLARCWDEVLDRSNFSGRLSEVDTFNRKNKYQKKGLGIVPVMFGSGFEAVFLNQAGALVLVYNDGSVLVSHGGVEMGQGLHTKMIQVASRELQIPTEKIHILETSTDKVPNSSPTAATSSSDLYGMAVLDACRKIMKRLESYKERKPGASWETLVNDAYMDRVSLSATGFFKTPGLTDKDEDFLQGNNMFAYFTFGAAVSEVLVDCLTGDHQVLRADIVMDVGKSLNPAIDVGQIEGGFVQGLGLYTLEELLYSPKGQLLTTGPGMYKIPTLQDIPKAFNVYFLRDSSNPRAIYSSKGVGEPPLLLAASVFSAIRQSVKAYRTSSGLDGRNSFSFESPATVEIIRMACADQFIKKVEES